MQTPESMHEDPWASMSAKDCWFAEHTWFDFFNQIPSTGPLLTNPVLSCEYGMDPFDHTFHIITIAIKHMCEAFSVFNSIPWCNCCQICVVSLQYGLCTVDHMFLLSNGLQSGNYSLLFKLFWSRFRISFRFCNGLTTYWIICTILHQTSTLWTKENVRIILSQIHYKGQLLANPCGVLWICSGPHLTPCYSIKTIAINTYRYPFCYFYI